MLLPLTDKQIQQDKELKKTGEIQEAIELKEMDRILIENLKEYIKVMPKQEKGGYKIGSLFIAEEQAKDEGGESKVADSSFYNGKIKFTAEGNIVGENIFAKSLIADTIKTEDLRLTENNIGVVSIKSGKDKIKVEFKLNNENISKDEYIVILTPSQGLYQGYQLKQYDNYFEIKLEKKLEEEVKFNYMIFRNY